jgi:hypothetical protein
VETDQPLLNVGQPQQPAPPFGAAVANGVPVPQAPTSASPLPPAPRPATAPSTGTGGLY